MATARVHPREGQPAPPELLGDVPPAGHGARAERPDPSRPSQRVRFDTSGHRRSSFQGSFSTDGDGAPGNGRDIGGVKVITEHGWFRARPSDTEAVYGLYAERFKGSDDLLRMQAEARAAIGKIFRTMVTR